MTLPQFEPIEQAVRSALETLDATVPVCQAIADTGEGLVCIGCLAKRGDRCIVQEARDLLRDQLEVAV